MPVNIINREAAEALIQEQLAPAILQDTPKSSIFMQLARRMPNMSSKTTRMRVLDALPTAYWVNGDTGMKQTSSQAWDNKYMVAAELAVIVPVPESVLDDSDTDIMGEVQPRILEAIGKRVDEACIFDVSRPTEWQGQAGIITVARQAGNNVTPDALPDYYDLLLGEGGVISKVEETGHMVNGAIASMAMRAKLRGIVGNDGHPIFKSDMQGPTQYALDGAPMYFPTNGAFDKNVAQLVVGDWSQAVYSIRQDITVKILDQGVIQDPATGKIIYNLAQQDMIAIRVVFRMGWALPNYATQMDPDGVSVPFAYLEPAVPVTTKTVTYTVQDGEENPVEGALVEISGARVKTNADGEAVFTLPAGDYTAKVKAKGFKAYGEELTVAAADVEKTVTLTASN